MFPYFTLDEISKKSGLSHDQIIRLGFSGTLVLSVLKHSPQNYKEIVETANDDGTVTTYTKTNETVVIVKRSGPALNLVYIAPEDVINIVTNDAPNRKTLVRATYNTRDILPKLGSWHLNNPMELTPADLLVSQDEWERFSRGPGRKLKNYLPLLVPEKITVRWLLTNLSVKQWLAAVVAVASIFGAGVYVATNADWIRALLPAASASSHESPN